MIGQAFWTGSSRANMSSYTEVEVNDGWSPWQTNDVLTAMQDEIRAFPQLPPRQGAKSKSLKIAPVPSLKSTKVCPLLLLDPAMQKTRTHIDTMTTQFRSLIPPKMLQHERIVELFDELKELIKLDVLRTQSENWRNGIAHGEFKVLQAQEQARLLRGDATANDLFSDCNVTEAELSSFIDNLMKD